MSAIGKLVESLREDAKWLRAGPNDGLIEVSTYHVVMADSVDIIAGKIETAAEKDVAAAYERGYQNGFEAGWDERTS